MVRVLIISLYSLLIFGSENHIGDCNNQGSTAPNDELFEEDVVSEDIAKCYNYNQYDAYQYLYPQVEGHDSSLKRISQLDELTTDISMNSNSSGKPLGISREESIRSVLYRDSFNVYQSTREFAAVEKISPCGCVPRNKLEEHLAEPFNEFNDIVVEEAKKKSKQIFKNRVKNAFQNLADLNNLFMLGKVDRNYLPEIAECSLNKMKTEFSKELKKICPAENNVSDIVQDYFDNSSKPYFNQMTNEGRVSCLSDMEVDTLMAYSNPNIYFEPISPVYNETTYLTSIGSYESDSIKHFEYMGQYKNIIARMAYENETIKNIIDETIKKLQEEDPPKMLPDWFNKIDYGEDDGGINDLLLNNPQLIHEIVQNTRASCEKLYINAEVIKAAFCPLNSEIPETSYKLTNRGAHGIANNKCQKRGRRIVPKMDKIEVIQFYDVRKFLAPLNNDDSSYDSEAYSMFCYDKENLKTRTDMYRDLNSKIRDRLKSFYGPKIDNHMFYVAFSNNEICKNGEHQNENGPSDKCKQYKKRVYDYLINNKEDPELEKVFLDSYFESSGLMVSDSSGDGVMNEEKMPLIEMVYLRDAIKKDIESKGDSIRQDTVMSKAFIQVFETDSNDESKQQVFTEYAQNSTQEDVDNLVAYRETRTVNGRSDIPYVAKTTVDYNPVSRPTGEARFISAPTISGTQSVGDTSLNQIDEISDNQNVSDSSSNGEQTLATSSGFQQPAYFEQGRQEISRPQARRPINEPENEQESKSDTGSSKFSKRSFETIEDVERERRELNETLRNLEQRYESSEDNIPQQRSESSPRIEDLKNQLRNLDDVQRNLEAKHRSLQNQKIAQDFNRSISSGASGTQRAGSLGGNDDDRLSSNEMSNAIGRKSEGTDISGQGQDEDKKEEKEETTSVGGKKSIGSRGPASSGNGTAIGGNGASIGKALEGGGNVKLNEDGGKTNIEGDPLLFDEFTFDRVIRHKDFLKLRDFFLFEFKAAGRDIFTLEEIESDGKITYIARHFVLKPTIAVKLALGGDKMMQLTYDYAIEKITAYLNEPEKHQEELDIISKGYVLKEEKELTEIEANRFKLSLITYEEIIETANKLVERDMVEEVIVVEEEVEVKEEEQVSE